MALEREESLSFEGQRSGHKWQAWWPKQKLGAHILNHKHGAERANRKLSNPPSPHPLTYFLQEGCTCTSPQTAPPPGGQAVKHPHLWGHLQLNCYRPRDQKLGSATRPGSPGVLSWLTLRARVIHMCNPHIQHLHISSGDGT